MNLLLEKSDGFRHRLDLESLGIEGLKHWLALIVRLTLSLAKLADERP